FYGKVIDDEGVPVQGATVGISIAGPNGDSETMVQTDAQGLFSVTGKRGKFITVGMDKRGYGRGPQSYGTFEFAEFFSERFHEPDPNNPVVFVLPRLNP
ncbi:MAG: carboxypeptidase-like regulatory domain-containing protein, partial [Verrucomicrobiales bacterium]